ncbi:hypothetical protein LIER_26089 [Lithospermum erythrorhizon]|uniref:Senescence regulator n=1 Tax=Lithospermum erythrorhizon TaxID=34254 RepID=A0AAV3RAC9_LITER
MAKGRQLTTSRSEHLLGNYTSFFGGADDSDLREEDIWPSYGGDSFNEEIAIGTGSMGEWGTRAATECDEGIQNYGSGRHSPRGDHKHHPHVGGLSVAFDESNGTSTRIVHQFHAHEGVAPSSRGQHMATSAPVNVPDWSKIYRVDSVESVHDSDVGDEHELEWLPPHEHAAREHARSRRTTAGSVFEGVGRTLKGRDLSRVRDAVWSQTGFDG